MDISAFYCLSCKSEDLYFNSKEKNLICSNCGCSLANWHHEEDYLDFLCGVFKEDEYNQESATVLHDNALEWLFATHNTSEAAFRSEVIDSLGRVDSARILITGAGTGNDMPIFLQRMNSGELFLQDASRLMIREAKARYEHLIEASEVKVNLSVSDACQLPFKDGYFDFVYHLGGFNIFKEPKMGISEMYRVVRDGGTLLVCDEGMAPWLCDTEYGKAFSENNRLYNLEFPLDLLPNTKSKVMVTWVLNQTFYVVRVSVNKNPYHLDLTIRHKGIRGGSIESRYFGKLEGIDPKLKSELYDYALRVKRSRVDLLEDIVESFLEANRDPEV